MNSARLKKTRWLFGQSSSGYFQRRGNRESPLLGERVANHRSMGFRISEFVTPHPDPLPEGEGADEIGIWPAASTGRYRSMSCSTRASLRFFPLPIGERVANIVSRVRGYPDR